MLIDVTAEGVTFLDNTIYPSAGSGVDLAFSVEVWLKPGSDINNNHFFYSYNDTDIVFRMGPIGDGGGNNLRASLFGPTQSDAFVLDRVGLVVTASVWQHFIFTYSGNKTINGMDIKINNEISGIRVDGSIGTPDGIPDLGANDFTILLPRHDSTPGFQSGDYNYFRWFNKQLSDSEITTLYNSGVPISLASAGINAADCDIEYGFNNDFVSSIGVNPSQIGSPTFNTNLPT